MPDGHFFIGIISISPRAIGCPYELVLAVKPKVSPTIYRGSREHERALRGGDVIYGLAVVAIHLRISPPGDALLLRDGLSERAGNGRGDGAGWDAVSGTHADYWARFARTNFSNCSRQWSLSAMRWTRTMGVPRTRSRQRGACYSWRSSSRAVITRISTPWFGKYPAISSNSFRLTEMPPAMMTDSS
jgi:hypothetical protein